MLMESNGICTNLFTEEPLKIYHNGIQAVNQTKTPFHFLEVPQNYDNLTNVVQEKGLLKERNAGMN